MRLNTCPCCGSPMLKHARQGGLYWFCTYCRQDMPILSGQLARAETVGTQSRPVQTLKS
jgi:ribosomal protein L37AE/L43A